MLLSPPEEMICWFKCRFWCWYSLMSRHLSVQKPVARQVLAAGKCLAMGDSLQNFFYFCVPQLYLWGSPFFFCFCVPSCISGIHHSSSSSVFPAISLGLTILLLLLCSPAISLGFTILLLHSQLYLWGSPFFFFCVPQLYLWVHHSSSSSSAFPAISLGVTILLLLLLRSQLYLWGSPFFLCVPSYISGVHHSSFASAFPAMSLGFTILFLRARSQLYLWGSPFFFYVPSYISGVHHSSCAFPAISLGFTILLPLLRSKLYLWGSPFFSFVHVHSYISGVHHSSSAFPSNISGVHHTSSFCAFPSYICGYHHSSSFCVFPAISLGFTILLPLCFKLSLGFTILRLLLRSQLYLWGSSFLFFLCIPSYISGVHHSFSFGFPAISLGFTILGEFLRMWPLKKHFLMQEVLTFGLRGWCMLHVFLLLAFTCLGHECQYRLGPYDGVCVCTD